MKRCEYCSLSKTVSQYMLDQILSGDATEVVVERIHEYLAIATISNVVRSSSTSSSSTSGWAKTPKTTPTPKACRMYKSRSGRIYATSPYGLVMLFRTSVLVLETGTEREILLRQSEPDIRTNFAMPAPTRSKLVSTARRFVSHVIFY
jgi:hypothetical protein